MTSFGQEPDHTHWPDSANELPAPEVGRLIYASVSSIDGPVLDEMRRIRDQAAVHNQAHGLRVVLMHTCGWFVQWIEGPPSGIQALIERVGRDPRHRALKVVHDSMGRPRLIKPWIGSIGQATETAGALARRVMAMRERQALGKGYEPATVWRSLCSPLPGHVEVAAAREGGWQRVMLLSARHTGAFDLLRWLAKASQGSVAHRRFAGGVKDALDVESDYLDLPDQGPQGRRLIANARKGLAMGMTHAFLPDHAAVVLLLDADAGHNQRLLERLLVVCQQVRHRPAIIGLGADACFAPELRFATEARGQPWLEARTGAGAASHGQLWMALKTVLDRLG